MPISRDTLSSIISKNAASMGNPNWDRLVESNVPDAYDPDPSRFDDPYADYFPDEDTTERQGGSSRKNAMQYNEEMVKNSKLPDAIKKSMMEKRIDTPSMGGNSVLDNLSIPRAPKKNRQAINEQINPRQVAEATGSVDYTIIKAIVNECLREYFSAQPLNESAGLQTIGLQNGNITLVDNKGNVFQAKLQKIGNKNDRQQ